MKCPSCGQKMPRDFCIFCGYMKNGSYISKERKQTLSDLERYLGKDYNKVLRNETYFSTFLLGPLYLCYKKFILAGIVLECLNVVMFVLVAYFLLALGLLGDLTLLFYFLFSKFIWMTIDNMIYIALLEKKIEKIKIKYKEHYKEKLENQETKSILSFLIAILLYLLVITVVIIIYWKARGRL